MTKRIGLKIAIVAVVVVVVVAIGFFYLIRSCLAKFDERSSVGGGGGSSQAASQFLVFEKDGIGVIFSLVKYDRTTSYSQKGGSTRKSVSTTYYAQTNDFATAEKKSIEKIKKHSDIKAYPVELLGATTDKAWLFAGELMAFDPFTLAKAADAAMIEEKNPALKGKLIHERRYYEFDHDSRQIILTAADGAKYSLNTNTLAAIPAEGSKTGADETIFMDLEKKIGMLRTANARAYGRLRAHNQRYREKQMSVQEYKDSSTAIQKEVSLLDKERDSLEAITKNVASTIRTAEKNKQRKNNARRNGAGFNGMKLNNDTLHGNWYGLYTEDEARKIGGYFDHRVIYGDGLRNKFITAQYTRKDDNSLVYGDRVVLGNSVFLDGGFLIDKETGLPFHLGQDFLIVYKDRIGSEGVVQLARVGMDGKQKWTISTGLKDFYDWQLKGDRLIVAGTDNEDLSSGEVNLMQIITLSNGSVVAYDFFKDEVRKGD